VSGATGSSVSLLPDALRFQPSEVAKKLGSAEGIAPSGGGGGAIPSAGAGAGAAISGSAQACEAVPNGTRRLMTAMVAIRTSMEYVPFITRIRWDVVLSGVAVAMSQWRV
jgi:hypothetical protein